MQHSLRVIVVLLLVCGVLVVGVSYWIGANDTQNAASLIPDTELSVEEPLSVIELADYEPSANINPMNPVAVMTTNYGVVEIELFDDFMPITAGNFMKLAREGFFDDTKFHRVIDSFIVQGGDPISRTDDVLRYGTGNPGYTIPDEHIAHEKLTNVRGTIAMANSGPNSGGSQFFINLIDNVRLDFDKPPTTSKHPVFGQVINGMDIVDTIGAVETSPSKQPLEPVVVESVVIREG